MFPLALIVHQNLSCLYLNWTLPYAFKTFLVLSFDPQLSHNDASPEVFASNPVISQECVITLCLLAPSNYL